MSDHHSHHEHSFNPLTKDFGMEVLHHRFLLEPALTVLNKVIQSAVNFGLGLPQPKKSITEHIEDVVHIKFHNPDIKRPAVKVDIPNNRLNTQPRPFQSTTLKI